MAIALGLSPREVEAIADDDPVLFETLAEACRTKWGVVEELLAGLYEMSHAQYRVLLQLGGAKKNDLPAPVRVPRPGQAVKKVKATGAEFAAWIGRRGKR